MQLMGICPSATSRCSYMPYARRVNAYVAGVGWNFEERVGGNRRLAAALRAGAYPDFDRPGLRAAGEKLLRARCGDGRDGARFVHFRAPW